tara:strand:- start:152 stop:418 length:267 start_codon:yes stop_codon:yes gene_type:complete
MTGNRKYILRGSSPTSLKTPIKISRYIGQTKFARSGKKKRKESFWEGGEEVVFIFVFVQGKANEWSDILSKNGNQDNNDNFEDGKNSK